MIKPKTFRPWTPGQTHLMPPSPIEWLPSDHLVFFLLDLQDELDFSAIMTPALAKDSRGEKGFDPRMMTLLLLYAYCVGIVSSRKIARVVSLGHVALDGTKVKANASNHKAEEQLQKEIEELMRQAENVDAEDDGKYGKGKRGSDLPEELQRREERLEKNRQAWLELEAQTAAVAAREGLDKAAAADAAAREASEEDRQKLSNKADRAREKAEVATELAMEKAELAGLEPPDLEPLESDQMPRRGLAHQADATPTAKTQRNFTDPECHIMKGNAVGVSNQAPDMEHLEPMLERTIANTGAILETFIADAGYWSEDNAETCTEAQMDPHIATGRQKHGQPPPCTKGRIPNDLDPKGRMARKLRTKKGREIYAKRKTIPEPVFGQIKEGRGLRRFLMRGLEKVNGEWTLWSLTHNILELFRFQRTQAAGAMG